MRNLIFIFSISLAVAGAYRNGRSATSSFEEYPPYQSSGQHLPFREQYQPFREQSFKSERYLPYRSRTHRQEPSYPERPPFTDQSLLRDYPSLKDQTFYGSQPSYKDTPNFKEQRPTYNEGVSFSTEDYRDQTSSYRNEQSFQDQANFKDQYQYQQQRQPFREDHRSFLDEAKPYRAESYEKPLNSNKQPAELERQPLSFGGHSSYLKYGNHGLGFASVPTISSYESAVSLKDEASTTTESTPAAPTATHKSLLESTASAASSTVTKLHVFPTADSKITPMKFTATTMPDSKSNTVAEILATPSTGLASITPNISDTTKGLLESDRPSTSLTTAAGLQAMATETPLMSYQGPTLPPIRFDTSKLKEGMSPDAFYFSNDLKTKLQPSMLNLMLSQEQKIKPKNDLQGLTLDYILPEIGSNSLNQNVQQGPVVNYVLPEESKNKLKSIQNTWMNYLLHQGPKRGGMPLYQSSVPQQTQLNYLPLSSLAAERTKFTLPSIPISSLSGMSRPLQTINYMSTTLPRVSILQDSTASSGLSLGSAFVPGLHANTPSALSTSIRNGIPAALAAGISSGLGSSLSHGVSQGLSSLNFGQTYQHVDHVPQFSMPKSQMYAQGFELQLGDLPGMDYSLQEANLGAARPMEFGFEKVGLSLPELTRSHVSPFAKVNATSANYFPSWIWPADMVVVDKIYRRNLYPGYFCIDSRRVMDGRFIFWNLYEPAEWRKEICDRHGGRASAMCGMCYEAIVIPRDRALYAFVTLSCILFNLIYE